MAHELAQTKTGEWMMAYAGETPWHRLGKSLGAANVDRHTMFDASGLGWRVGMRPATLCLADLTPGEFQLVNGADIITVPDKFVTYRMDTNEPLGVVGASYTIFQNETCFEFMDAITSMGVSYETAGGLRGGRRIWISGKLEGALHVLDDRIDQHLLLASSHDSSLELTVRFSGTRVVCANTLAAALRGAKDTSSIYRVRHTSELMNKVDQAQTVLKMARAFYDDLGGALERMGRAKVTRDQATKYVEEVVGAGKRTEKIRDRVLSLAGSGRGNSRPEIAGTVYTLYNGFTEWLTHEKVSRGYAEATETEQYVDRVESNWFGGNAEMNADAFALAVKMADEIGVSSTSLLFN